MSIRSHNSSAAPPPSTVSLLEEGKPPSNNDLVMEDSAAGYGGAENNAEAGGDWEDVGYADFGDVGDVGDGEFGAMKYGVLTQVAAAELKDEVTDFQQQLKEDGDIFVTPPPTSNNKKMVMELDDEVSKLKKEYMLFKSKAVAEIKRLRGGLKYYEEKERREERSLYHGSLDYYGENGEEYGP